MPSVTTRCRAHPARPAHDRCPSCDRPRCRSDAEAAPAHCPVCSGSRPGRPRAEAERLVRAALATALVVPLCGAVGTQYVDAGAARFLIPVLTAVVVAEAVLRAGGRIPLGRHGLDSALRVLAVGGALLAVAAALAFAPGRSSVVEPPGRALPAYGVAAVAAVLWTRPRRGRPSPSAVSRD